MYRSSKKCFQNWGIVTAFKNIAAERWVFINLSTRMITVAVVEALI
jgi:hypothetical protein